MTKKDQIIDALTTRDDDTRDKVRELLTLKALTRIADALEAIAPPLKTLAGCVFTVDPNNKPRQAFRNYDWSRGE